jgi:NADP-dependent 3-hydroxy acid dehydrogenase YdfG
MSPRSLVDKFILVTGASSGIGKATAKLLAANGARLIVAARSFDKLQSLAQEIDAFPVACDVTSLDSIKKMVTRRSGIVEKLTLYSRTPESTFLVRWPTVCPAIGLS